MARLDDLDAEFAAAALIKADQFVRTLEELRKGGDAVKYHGGVQEELIGSPVAVVTIDGKTIDDALGTPWGSFRRYELVLGVTDELIKEDTIAQRRYLDHTNIEKTGQVAEEGHLTGWRSGWGEQRHLLVFGGRVWSKGSYVINFIPEGKLSIPPSYDSESIKGGLRANKHSGRFFPPRKIGDQMLAQAAKGLKRCLEYGVLLNPTVRIHPHVHRVAIDEIGDNLYRVGIYQLSQNAFSKLEAVCLQKRNL